MFLLEQFEASDGLLHQGIVARPQSDTSSAVVWIHGLTSTFYSNVVMIRTLANACLERKQIFVACNTRGHDMITGIKKVDSTSEKGYTHVMGGAGYEVFDECTRDIIGIIDGLQQRYGVSQVHLIGHSTGANKVVYCVATTADARIASMCLLAPMSDRAIEQSQEGFTEKLQLAKQLLAEERGNELVNTFSFFPMTARRYISLFDKESSEDQFRYADTPAQFPYLTKVSIPVLALFAGEDEYACGDVNRIVDTFTQSMQGKSFSSRTLPAAGHNFSGYESHVADAYLNFISATFSDAK